jgi:exodeoxyribonuclease I
LSEYSFDSFHAELAALRAAHAGDGRKLSLLDQVEAWARDLQSNLQ